MSSQAMLPGHAGALNCGPIGCTFPQQVQAGESDVGQDVPKSSVPQQFRSSFEGLSSTTGEAHAGDCWCGRRRRDRAAAEVILRSPRGGGSVEHRLPLTLHPMDAELTGHSKTTSSPLHALICRSARALARNGVHDDQFVQETMLRCLTFSRDWRNRCPAAGLAALESSSRSRTRAWASH
jgi:hypothetical protein